MWWLTELDALLQCPRCAGALSVEEMTDDGQGLIRCAKAECGLSYPVIDGIPRFLLGEERKSFVQLHWHRLTAGAKRALSLEYGEAVQWEGQKITMRSYDFQHRNLYELAYSDPKVAEKTLATVGKTFRLLYPAGNLKHRKLALEVGVGIGGMLKNLSLHAGPDTRIVGVDLTSSLDFAARQFTREELATRVLLVQASVFDLPLRPGIADFVLSHGVLHHTPDPQRAFDECAARVAPGGEIHVWVYGDRFRSSHPTLYRMSCAFRDWHSRLSPALLWKLCAVYAVGSRAVAPLARPIFPYRFPVRKLRRFWMDNLLNPYNHVYNREELLRWSRPDLAGFDVESTGGAWTIHATRPASAAEAA
ncbi:MAG TPA: methyltransferase domain-containing protein [Longimicrobium sp.]|jgi:SAM-dependent methyltransferase/uncharacterized protein YbaR (Trm112 family)|uniref:methyltransferase domain-containing protein n=1 Tax=Longimicrobium sp. TaxID=2029185 RepID=UPI002EDA41CC